MTRSSQPRSARTGPPRRRRMPAPRRPPRQSRTRVVVHQGLSGSRRAHLPLQPNATTFRLASRRTFHRDSMRGEQTLLFKEVAAKDPKRDRWGEFARQPASTRHRSGEGPSCGRAVGEFPASTDCEPALASVRALLPRSAAGHSHHLNSLSGQPHCIVPGARRGCTSRDPSRLRRRRRGRRERGSRPRCSRTRLSG